MGERIENLVRQTYKPTRFEYFVGQALQGVLVGRAEKDLPKFARMAVRIARHVEDEIGAS